ncbi:MAG: DegV family protein [Caldilineae bacterium]|nr:DegV family protein [Anaerolineae bacterium]MCB0199729.1 DegV family protein [Anaerolineae bacterium]MCB0205599.1 DegV family protein [Anaerolineae bacterium]MCB0252212.1 DegV family protein [Anaerolineae bacterium]MCB9153519.1 DegV family protein [Caldilineae bacterium]
MSIRVICDSSQNVPESLLSSLNLIEVPASVIFGDEVYLNKVELSDQEFYRRLSALPKGDPLPTTTQPTPGQFISAIEQAKAEGATGIVITAVSSHLSGTYNSAVQAAAQESEVPVEVWDTLSASIGGGWQTIAAAEMVSAGASLEEVAAALPAIQRRINTFFTVDTLKFLVAGGRLSPIQGMMGTLLNVKPMLAIEDGLLKPLGRERGRKTAKNALLNLTRERVGDKPVRVTLAHANVREEAEAFVPVVRAGLNVQELYVVELGPVLAALAGPGLMALGTLEVVE